MPVYVRSGTVNVVRFTVDVSRLTSVSTLGRVFPEFHDDVVFFVQA